MSGIDYAEEVTASHLEALAGGELLQAEVRDMSGMLHGNCRMKSCGMHQPVLLSLC